MDKRVLFAQALAAAIRGDRVNWDGVCGQQEWKDLFLLTQQHRVVPLILEAVYACPDFGSAEQPVWKREAMMHSANQTTRTAVFEEIFQQTQTKLRRLMNIPDEYKILFLQTLF